MKQSGCKKKANLSHTTNGNLFAVREPVGRGGAGHRGGSCPTQSREVTAQLQPLCCAVVLSASVHALCFQGTHNALGIGSEGRRQFAIFSAYIACEEKPQVLAWTCRVSPYHKLRTQAICVHICCFSLLLAVWDSE